ncbi:hypothetical protein [Paenibacillus sp. YSY-4.3]
MRKVMEQAQNFDEVNVKAGNKAFQYSLAYYEDFLKELESGSISKSAPDHLNTYSRLRHITSRYVSGIRLW